MHHCIFDINNKRNNDNSMLELLSEVGRTVAIEDKERLQKIHDLVRAIAKGVYDEVTVRSETVPVRFGWGRTSSCNSEQEG